MNRDDQAATLRRMHGAPLATVPPPRRHVVAITGGKGGVGKSMFAVNIAALWASRGARTLALDGDLGMADLNLLLGLAPTRSLADLLRGCPIDEVLLEAHGVHLLPALNGSAELANLDRTARAALLASVDALRDRFDALVIDTAAGIGDTVLSLAGAAADIIVVATPEPLSLADAYACIKVLATRHGVNRVLLAPNAVRSPSEADEIVARLSGLVDRFLGIPVLPLPGVPYDPCASAAAAAGVPLVLHQPDAPASRALRKLALRLDAVAFGDQRPRLTGLWRRPAVAAQGR